jgi:hypothetical protein
MRGAVEEEPGDVDHSIEAGRGSLHDASGGAVEVTRMPEPRRNDRDTCR